MARFWQPSWLDEEDIDEFKIYRSTSPGVGYTDFHTETENEPFRDRGVEKGKTYYYRVTAIDKAGNEASLSKEVYATVLLNEQSTSSSSGLELRLRGRVDNFLT